MKMTIDNLAGRLARMEAVFTSAQALNLDARINTEHEDALAVTEKAVDLFLAFVETRCHEVMSIQKKYQALYEGSRDAIMTLAPPDWNFTSGNPATVAMFKAKNESDFIAIGPVALSPEFQPDGQSSSDKAKVSIGVAMETGSYFFEWTHKRLTGEEFPATVLLTRMDSDDQPFLQATVRDITEQKRADANLHTALDEAERLNRITMGREYRVVQMKREVNALLAELDRPLRYASVAEDAPHE
jgi:PAS domain-containing protein